MFSTKSTALVGLIGSDIQGSPERVNDIDTAGFGI